MSVWVHKNGKVTIGVDRDALGFVLEGFSKDVNSVAEEAASRARKALPQPGMQRFIGVKRAGSVGSGNQGLWPLRMRGRRYGSGTGERLMRGVWVPVALVTNNSALAMTWEYGAIPQMQVVYRRKGGKKIAGHGSRDKYDDSYYRQYQPLLNGARQVSRARLVERYRRGR